MCNRVYEKYEKPKKHLLVMIFIPPSSFNWSYSALFRISSVSKTPKQVIFLTLNIFDIFYTHTIITILKYIGLIITSTEQKSRETSYALSKSENNLKQEKEEHEKTIDTLKETTVKFNTLKDLHQQIEIQLKTTTEEKNINDQEILKVLKEMKKMEGKSTATEQWSC